MVWDCGSVGEFEDAENSAGLLGLIGAAGGLWGVPALCGLLGDADAAELEAGGVSGPLSLEGDVFEDVIEFAFEPGDSGTPSPSPDSSMYSSSTNSSSS